MAAIVDGVCAAQGATGFLDHSTSFQPLINDAAATDRAVAAAKSVGFVDADHGRMGFAEDFARYLDHVPGAFMMMGNGTEGAQAMPLHNPAYDFNDRAIPAGVAYWTALAKQTDGG